MEFLKYLEGIRTPFGENLFMLITYGGAEITLLGLICILYWCVNKKDAYRMTFAYLTSALAVNIIKLTCRVERPWVRDPSFTAVEKAKASATGYSFPSGHTQNATALFITLSHLLKKNWAKILVLLIIPLVMLSRMYLGVHTPADVLVSLGVSTVLVVAVNLIVDKIPFDQKRRFILMLVLLFIASATMVYTFLLLKNGIITEDNAADTFKGCGAGLGFGICWYIENTYINFNPKACSPRAQILKFIIGVSGALLFKEGLKFLLGQSIFVGAFRYFVVMLWAMLAMPLIIKKFFTTPEKENA